MLSEYLTARIQDAALWYGDMVRRSTARPALRSPELKPKYSFFEVFRMCQSVESVAKFQATLVGEVCLARSIRLRDRNVDELYGDNTIGRLLVLDTFSCTYDGLASDSTGGFFDDGDCPPWDLWIDYEIKTDVSSRDIRGLLSAWIPKEYFPTVEEAILVSGGDALFWGSSEHPGFQSESISAFVEELGRSVLAA